MSRKFHKDPTNLYHLDDEVVEKIRPYCPKPRREKVPFKIFINAIVYIMLYEPTWRSIHGKYEVIMPDGSIEKATWDAIYRRYNRWSHKGVFEAIYKRLQFLVYMNSNKNWLFSLDSTSLKCAPHVCSKDDKTIGISRGGRNTKLHVITGNDYFPCIEMLTGGNIHDSKPGLELIKQLKFIAENLAADKAYIDIDIRKTLYKININPVIPPKKNTKIPWEYDKNIYKERSIVENYFCNLKRCRHIISRTDRSPVMFMSFIYLFSIVAYFTHEHKPACGRWH